MAGRVRLLAPATAIEPTGTRSVGARAGDFVFVAGMRGIDPSTNELVADEEARVRQAFENMKTIAAGEGASLADCVRLVIYVADMGHHRPMVNSAQQAFSPDGAYPPRIIVEVARLNRDDIVEVEGTFYAPAGP